MPPQPPKPARHQTVHDHRVKARAVEREPSAIPRSLREALPIIARTANHRWTSTGESANPGQHVLTRDDAPWVGEWRPSGRALVVNDRRTDEPAQWPISTHAKELLAAFLQREAFLQAICDKGYPVEEAGWLLLNKKKRQSYTIYKELQRYETEDDDGASGWMRAEARMGYEKGTIFPGRETSTSPMADSFYTALGGGIGCLYELYRQLLDEQDVEMGKLHRERDRVGREFIDYVTYSHLLQRKFGIR